METLGQRIKALREKAGISAAALGQKTGLRENAVYKIEAGDTKQPEFFTGLRIAHALGVDPWYLAFGKERSNVTRLRPAEPDEWRPRDLDEAESLSQDGFAAIALLQSQLDELRQEMQLVRDRLPEVGTKPSPKGRRSG